MREGERERMRKGKDNRNTKVKVVHKDRKVKLFIKCRLTSIQTDKKQMLREMERQRETRNERKRERHKQ